MFGLLNLSPSEAFILLGLGVLLFGRRLPEVGRWVGQGFRSFKEGVSGVEAEIHETLHRSDPEGPKLPAVKPPERISCVVPKFDEQSSTIAEAPPTV